MPETKSQSSDKPQAVELLRNFLKENNIVIKTLPLKTWTDDSGRFVIDPPQIAVAFAKDEKEEKING